MNLRHLAGVAIAAVALGSISVVPARAQGFPGFSGRQIFGRFGRTVAMSDPTFSNMMSLLTRPDVQNALAITFKQKNDLEDMQNSALTDMISRARETFKDVRNLTPEERAAQKDQLQAKGREMMVGFVGELDKKTEALLKPEQLKRLKEIDLQWRGPMALGDPKIADAVGLTNDEKTKVQEVVGEFRAHQAETFRNAFQGFAQRRGPGQPGDATQQQSPPSPPDPAEIQQSMATAEQEITKLKKASGAKVLALLTDDERQKWQSMTGRQFIFQTIADVNN